MNRVGGFVTGLRRSIGLLWGNFNGIRENEKIFWQELGGVFIASERYLPTLSLIFTRIISKSLSGSEFVLGFLRNPFYLKEKCFLPSQSLHKTLVPV